jgi:hypothetical protein
VLQTVRAAKAAVAIAGCIVALLAVVERTMSVVKQVSDSILDSANFFTIGKAHKEKTGFQHEVSALQSAYGMCSCSQCNDIYTLNTVTSSPRFCLTLADQMCI